MYKLKDLAKLINTMKEIARNVLKKTCEGTTQK